MQKKWAWKATLFADDVAMMKRIRELSRSEWHFTEQANLGGWNGKTFLLVQNFGVKWAKLFHHWFCITFDRRDLHFYSLNNSWSFVFTCKWVHRAPSSRSAVTTRIARHRTARRWMRRIAVPGNLADRDTIACCRSYSGPIRLGSRKASGSAATETQHRRRRCASMLRNPTSPTSLFCDCCCLVAFVFRRLQVLYFLREMVLN